ncbi:hypothetical protein HDR58_05865, partial [bacterium]|nr:hypothetical protein [bacterium]
GGGPWPKDARDYKLILKDMEEISKLDGGIYKHNIMHINGFSPKQLVGCITYGMLTSRREICGITPLECKAGGVPYGTTLTGGPVDYTNPSNGFTTREAVELTPEHYGLSWGNTADEIDDARISRQAPQVSDIFKNMVDEHSSDRNSYIAKCKKNIEEKIDWHENAEYNMGKSANRRYLDDIWETDKGWEARNKSKLRRLTGKLGEFKDTVEELMHQSKSKPAKVILGVVLGSLAIASGVFMYLHKSSKKFKTVENNAESGSKLNQAA